MPDLSSILERADRAVSRVPLPGGGLERLQRRRDRKRRNQRIAAAVVGIAIFVVPVALIAGLISPDRTQTPGARESAGPSVAVIDQVFVDSINRCGRLLVTKQEVESALGFRPEHPAPSRSGCKYASFNKLQGDLVITAYTANAPPSPLGRSEPVLGIGDEARFTHLGNPNGAHGPEGATSILQVRIGDLILRFSASRFNRLEAIAGYELPALRRLAEDALSALDGNGPAVPEVDYVLDLRTGVMSALPKAIIRSLGEAGETLNPQVFVGESGHYAASPDGSLLAYVGTGDEGSLQIFIAGRAAGESPGPDGTMPRQVTHDPGGATSPAWSPDGTRIAYVGYGSGDAANLFVLDVATGESTQVTRRTLRSLGGGLQFTPDGSSVIYTGGPSQIPTIRTVPVDGGRSTLLIKPGNGLDDAGNGSLSPDGSLITYLGGGSPLAADGSPLTYHGRKITHAGPGRFLSKLDGTGLRLLRCFESNPAGTWSPDGTRIACMSGEGHVKVVDIATGDGTPVAEGRGAIWLDDHTLLVEV